MCNAGVSICAYSGYVDALQAVTPRQLKVVREPETQGRITYGRYILVQKYPVGMTSTQVSIEWRFDTKDMLTDIVVVKQIRSL